MGNSLEIPSQPKGGFRPPNDNGLAANSYELAVFRIQRETLFVTGTDYQNFLLWIHKVLSEAFP